MYMLQWDKLTSIDIGIFFTAVTTYHLLWGCCLSFISKLIEKRFGFFLCLSNGMLYSMHIYFSFYIAHLKWLDTKFKCFSAELIMLYGIKCVLWGGKNCMVTKKMHALMGILIFFNVLKKVKHKTLTHRIIAAILWMSAIAQF